MNATLKSIEGTRTWSSQHGEMVDINVLFEDGTKAFLTTKPDKLDKRIDEVTAILGKPGDFALEDRGKWDDGKPKPKKITDYPGKPQAGQGGGGKGNYLSFDEQLKLRQFDADARARNTALMCAVDITKAHEGVPTATDDVVKRAERYYEFLSVAGVGEGDKGKAPESTPARSVSAGTPTARGTQDGTPQPAPTEEAGPPTPPQESEPASDLSGDGASPPSGDDRASSPACAHAVWKDAPRAGWELCEKCGKARKKSWARASA